MPAKSQENQFASRALLEDEIKLDAEDKGVIKEAWNWVLKNTRHYHPAYHDHDGTEKNDDIDWGSVRKFKPRPPMRVRELLTRYYYDTRNLSLYQNQVELRIAHKNGAFKQVIKVGNEADQDNPMLRRPEYTGLMIKPRPNLSLINKEAEDREKVIKFLRKSTKGQGALKPVIAIEGQRHKRSYHPEGDRGITIELAADLGTGINISGYVWHIIQIELEIKENRTQASSAEILLSESGYLTRQFGALTPSLISKPTLGFDAFGGNPVMGKKKWGKQPVNFFQVLDAA